MWSWVGRKWPGISAKVDKLSEAERDKITFVMDLTKTAAGAVTVAGPFVGVFLTILNNHDEYAWRRKQFAEAQLQGWDSTISPTKARVDAALTRWGYKKNDHRLRPEHVEHIFHAVETDEQCWKLRRDITSMLNYFESVSSAVIEGTSNRSTIETSMEGTMADWRGNLAEYTAHADIIRKRPTWEPYYALTKQWKVVPQATIHECVIKSDDCPPNTVPASPQTGFASGCGKLEDVHRVLGIPADPRAARSAPVPDE